MITCKPLGNWRLFYSCCVLRGILGSVFLKYNIIASTRLIFINRGKINFKDRGSLIAVPISITGIMPGVIASDSNNIAYIINS